MFARRMLVMAPALLLLPTATWAAEQDRAAAGWPALQRGICAVIGLPGPDGAEAIVDRVKQSELVVYFQSADAAEVAAVREAAAKAGVLGVRVFADQGDLKRLHLADNVADAVLVAPTAEKAVGEEAYRIVHPEGFVAIGRQRITKQHPEGIDHWSHAWHGPDNNPLSTDRFARAPYLTQFLGDPKFCPMPEVSVAAGGRVFRAFGHIAHKANQNPMLNTLLAINGYNGTILWRRPLREGFMIHRNTMIATPDVLYLGDDQSCKLLNARTGELEGEIVVPRDLADGPVWKWMALDGGTLYALLGGEEVRPRTQPSNVPGLGHWPWGMWEGHEYREAKTNFGFGRTLLAIDPATKKILWNHRQDDFIDARGTCMKNGRIYFYCPGKYVACLDAASGDLAWKNSDRDLLDAIGQDGRAQHYVTGYSTTTFIKCNDDYLFFSGPQRDRLVVASTKDGRLAWQKQPGNLQLVLRDEAIYAAGPQGEYGFKFAYATGEQVGLLPGRRACTRATGTLDSVFFRANGGTVRMDVATGAAQHIAPMRPPCQDGVIVSDGLLYWGPWMCGCQLSFYGHICLGPAGDFDFRPAVDKSRLTVAADDLASVKPFKTGERDWPSYLGNNERTAATTAAMPGQVRKKWTFETPGGVRPTAPIIAGGTVFCGDESGAVRAIDAKTGKILWTTYTGGAIYAAPALWNSRLYVGSADGRVYAMEAATGRLLWSFRAAPADRWIPVYGKLMSTWPVAGGVAVHDGTVYAAAGIAHYDGTYVYALDAVTGEVKWCNDSSGSLSKEVDCGVSLQGELYIADGELRFLGGGKYEVARYDLQTGRSLNEPDNSIVSRFRTAFYPYYPDYGRYVSLEHSLADGKELIYDASYEGSEHSPLALYAALPPGTTRPASEKARWPVNRRGPRRESLWTDQGQSWFNAFVVTPGTLLAAGHRGTAEAEEPFLVAIEVATGKDRWREALPAAAVRAGAAIDGERRIAVALENGQVSLWTDE